MTKHTKEVIDETYNHVKNYMDKQREIEDLIKMCRRCEEWCGKEHDWEECRDKPCFQFWLCKEYIEWCEGW